MMNACSYGFYIVKARVAVLALFLFFNRNLRSCTICLLLLSAIPVYSHQDTVRTTAAQDTVRSPAPQDTAKKAGPAYKSSYYVSPSFGFVFTNTSRSNQETENLQWLSLLLSRYEASYHDFQFTGSLFTQYGQFHSKNFIPVKTQDDLILTLIPSYAVLPKEQIRLFLEVTAETDLGRGIVDQTETNFLDPLFLYETLYLGQKKNFSSAKGDISLDLMYGLGYAWQQTFTKNFVLNRNRGIRLDPTNPFYSPQDPVTYESGYSGVLDLYYRHSVTEDLYFDVNLRNVGLLRSGFSSIENSRVSTFLLTGFQYSIIAIDYNLRLLYDPNISKRRQLDQTLVFSVRYTFR